MSKIFVSPNTLCEVVTFFCWWCKSDTLSLEVPTHLPWWCPAHSAPLDRKWNTSMPGHGREPHRDRATAAITTLQTPCRHQFERNQESNTHTKSSHTVRKFCSVLFCSVLFCSADTFSQQHKSGWRARRLGNQPVFCFIQSPPSSSLQVRSQHVHFVVKLAAQIATVDKQQ